MQLLNAIWRPACFGHHPEITEEQAFSHSEISMHNINQLLSLA